MPNVTVAFDESVGGWTSQFTYLPDSGLSLNNNFYTFKNGRVYRHNSLVEDRNTFYGIFNNTELEFVFNDNPTYVKNYKALDYEGLGEWDTALQTNIESGTIAASHYVTKEGENYAWIRGESNSYAPDLESSAVAGIGLITDIDSDTYTFGNVPSVLSVGDFIYNVESNSGTFTGAPQLVGLVSERTNTTITTTTTGLPATPDRPSTFAVPASGDMFIYVKDNQVEKSGIIGFYNVVTMTNDSTDRAELFSVNANTFINSK